MVISNYVKFLKHVCMRKYCYREKISLENLTDLHAFSSSE
jgi:hypothetical protein